MPAFSSDIYLYLPDMFHPVKHERIPDPVRYSDSARIAASRAVPGDSLPEMRLPLEQALGAASGMHIIGHLIGTHSIHSRQWW